MEESEVRATVLLVHLLWGLQWLACKGGVQNNPHTPVQRSQILKRCRQREANVNDLCLPPNPDAHSKSRNMENKHWILVSVQSLQHAEGSHGFI